MKNSYEVFPLRAEKRKSGNPATNNLKELIEIRTAIISF